MKVLDLFSGIGGFILGLERAGMETIAFCEIAPFPRKVLDKWWPLIPEWEDIKVLNTCLKRALESSVVASRAKIYQQQAGVQELPENVVDSGGRCYEPFAWYDRSTSSWRTWQCCFIEGWERYSEGWPKAGMTRNGIAYRLLKSALRTVEKESGLWPTPSTSMGGGSYGNGGLKLPGAVKMYPTPQASDNRDRGNLSSGAVARRLDKGKQISLSQSVSEVSGQLNPMWVEWLMGFPCGWTDLLALATQSSPKSPNSSGEQ